MVISHCGILDNLFSSNTFHVYTVILLCLFKISEDINMWILGGDHMHSILSCLSLYFVSAWTDQSCLESFRGSLIAWWGCPEIRAALGEFPFTSVQLTWTFCWVMLLYNVCKAHEPTDVFNAHIVHETNIYLVPTTCNVLY